MVYKTWPHAIQARWVGRNSGPVFRRLWTKVHQIKYACAGDIAVVFRSTISRFISEKFAIKFGSCPKFARPPPEILMFSGRQIFSGEGTKFYKFGSITIEHNVKIWRRSEKKERKKNISSISECRAIKERSQVK